MERPATPAECVAQLARAMGLPLSAPEVPPPAAPGTVEPAADTAPGDTSEPAPPAGGAKRKRAAK